MNKTLTIIHEDGTETKVPYHKVVRFRTEGDKTYIITEDDIHEVEICFGQYRAWERISF